MNAIICLVLMCTTLSCLYADDWCVEISRVTPQVDIRFVEAASTPMPVPPGEVQFSLRLQRATADRSAWVLTGDTSSPLKRWVATHVDLSKVDPSIKLITIDGLRFLQALSAHRQQQPALRICAPGRPVSSTGCMAETDDDELMFVAVEREVSFDWSALQRNIKYPPVAVSNRIEGIVVVSALICTDGSILDVKVVESDNQLLNEAAVDAVRQTTFVPAIQNGAPVTCWTRIPIAFRLR